MILSCADTWHKACNVAAYRYLGQSYAALGRQEEAKATFQQGITVAEARGDLQTAKEMRVFLRRLHQGQAE